MPWVARNLYNAFEESKRRSLERILDPAVSRYPVPWLTAYTSRMAGVWTSVCVMFPALDAKAAGYKVYAVTDASGDPSEMASRTTVARFVQAGVVPTSTNAVLSEMHRTWNRPEAAELAKLYALVAPNYAAVIESFQKAQEAAKQTSGTAAK